MWTMRRFGPVLALATALCAGGAAGQGYDHDRFGQLLSEGRTATAADHARTGLEAAPDDPLARFDLGAAQFLLAVEHLGQGFYRHGLKPDYQTGFGLADLPFLRLPVPANPAPEPVTYAALRGILDRFVQDLAMAEATLVGVPAAPAFDAPLDLAAIRLDFDGDGQGSDGERLLGLLDAVAPRTGFDGGFAVDFDQSDAPWLRGYTQLLSAMAQFLLAHDWEAAFLASFHGLFPDTEMPGNAMTAEAARAAERLAVLTADPLNMSIPMSPSDPNQPKQGSLSFADWQAALDAYRRSDAYRAFLASDAYRAYLDRRATYDEIRRLRVAVQFGAVADLVAFLHLVSWDVTEPERIAAARGHLLAMVALSRENWVRIRAETDDRREWVPAPGQTGVFARLRVTERTVSSWLDFLDVFEAVLNGERLVSHWRFADRGINLRRMLEEQRRFDPWLIAQGAAVLPYLEAGEVMTADMAETMLELFGGDFFTYFIWFN